MIATAAAMIAKLGIDFSLVGSKMAATALQRQLASVFGMPPSSFAANRRHADGAFGSLTSGRGFRLFQTSNEVALFRTHSLDKIADAFPAVLQMKLRGGDPTH